ncbi:hypothetical protein [Mucilaginibacter koreensis]
MRLIKYLAYAFLALFTAESASAQPFHRRHHHRYTKHHYRQHRHNRM